MKYKEHSLSLQDMPDEILLKILSYLDSKSIFKCVQVCKRLRNVSFDNSMWQKVNLCGKIVPLRFIRYVINSGCKHLSLRGAKIEGDIGSINNNSQLKYLDCSNCFADPKVINR